MKPDQELTGTRYNKWKLEIPITYEEKFFTVRVAKHYYRQQTPRLAVQSPFLETVKVRQHEDPE